MVVVCRFSAISIVLFLYSHMNASAELKICLVFSLLITFLITFSAVDIEMSNDKISWFIIS